MSARDKLNQSESYPRDRVGNILTITGAAGTTTFTYDALYRLTNANYPGTADDKAYTYDAVGNRRTQTTVSGTLHYIHNNAGNRLDQVRQGSDTGPLVYGYSYDDAGNRIEKRDSGDALLQSCTYDQKNRITTLDSGGSVLMFEYDPNDYRIAKDHGTGTNRYLMEGEHYEAIYDGAGAIRAKFLRGVVVDEIVNGYYYAQGAKTNYTFHHDHLQSIVGLSGHNGDAEQTISYGPFGEGIGSNGSSPNVLGYTGRELDSETGLYYYRARYYDPEIGRFLNEDPLGFEAGINFYTYCSNNPINFNDPDGLEEIRQWTAEEKTAELQRIFSQNLTNQQIAQKYNPTPNLLDMFTGRANGGNPWAVRNLTADTVYGGPTDIDWALTLAYYSQHTGVDPLTLYGFAKPVWSLSDEFGSNYQSHMAEYFSAQEQRSVLMAQDMVNDRVHFSEMFPGISESATEIDFPFDYNGLQILPPDTGAFGGFVLYPNKPNTNMMRAVYAK